MSFGASGSSCSDYHRSILVEDEVQTRKIASQLPKVQLHLHLDGSLSEAFISKRAGIRQLQLPCTNGELRQHLLRSKQEAQSRSAYKQASGSNWNIFTFCNQFLQTADELREATYSIVTGLIAQNCRVIELRFCPQLHTLEGMTPDETIIAVTDAFRLAITAALPLRVVGGVILAALRSFPPAHVVEVVELAAKYSQHGVIAVDLAGDEETYPLATHAEALKTAHEQLVPLTLHTGEWGPSAVANIRTAICDVNASRLGHALALCNDTHLCDLVVQRQIPVETCLTANCSGGHKVPADAYHLHPLRGWLHAGVCVAGFNCDNLLLSGTLINRPDPTEEIVRARRACLLSWQQITQVLIAGARATFAHFESDENRQDFITNFTNDVNTVVQSVNGKFSLNHDG